MPRSRLTTAIVVEAAVDLADSEGLSALGISSVARVLGVKPASLYEHVDGIADLLDGAQSFALGVLGARLADALAGRAGRGAVRAFAEAHRACAAERPGVWSLVQRVASPATAASPEAARVANLTLATLRDYPIPPEQQVHAARLIGATINGFLNLARSEAFSYRPETSDASWASTVNALHRALTTWPTPNDPTEKDAG